MGCARGIPCLSCSVLAAVSSDILSSSAAGAVPTYHSPAPTGFSCHLATPTVCISYNALTLSAPTAFNRELTESHRQREICRAAADDLSEFALAESSIAGWHIAADRALFYWRGILVLRFAEQRRRACATFAAASDDAVSCCGQQRRLASLPFCLL